MMFTDTAEVATVDDALIARTAAWLTTKQKEDGSWSEEKHLHGDNAGLGASSLRATAYTAWCLAYAGREPQAVDQAVAYLEAQDPAGMDDYERGMVAVALATAAPDSPRIDELLAALAGVAITDEEGTHWANAGPTMVYGGGNAADVELTALIVLAMTEAGQYTQLVNGALKWLAASKDPQGNWGYSTQATVLALKALLGGGGPGVTSATLTVKLNGDVVATHEVDELTADVMWLADLSEHTIEGDNTLTLEYEGDGTLMYQVSAAHHLPWTGELPPADSTLALEVAYGKTTFAVDELVDVTATVTNGSADAQGMVMVEVGVAPGLELDTSPLAELKAQGLISNIEPKDSKLLLYVDALPAETPLALPFRVVARVPMEVSTPKSEAYFYYDKANLTTAPPITLTVQ